MNIVPLLSSFQMSPRWSYAPVKLPFAGRFWPWISSPSRSVELVPSRMSRKPIEVFEPKGAPPKETVPYGPLKGSPPSPPRPASAWKECVLPQLATTFPLVRGWGVSNSWRLGRSLGHWYEAVGS